MSGQPTFILSELAEIAGVQRDTLRMWERRGYFSLGDVLGGWRRFTFEQVMMIGTYAEIIRRTKDHEMAQCLIEAPLQYFRQRQDGVIRDTFYAVIYRTDAGLIDETLIDDEDEAFRFFRELLDGTALITCRIAFMIDIAGIHKDLAVRIMTTVNARKGEQE